jgi:hypothetical protein
MTDQAHAQHGERARDEEVEPGEREQRVQEERAQHVQLAVGEVHHAHDPEDQGEADAHQRIAAADDEAVDEVLDELGDHEAATRGFRPV